MKTIDHAETAEAAKDFALLALAFEQSVIRVCHGDKKKAKRLAIKTMTELFASSPLA